MDSDNKFWAVLWVGIFVSITIVTGIICITNLKEKQAFAKKGYSEKNVTYCQTNVTDTLWVKGEK